MVFCNLVFVLPHLTWGERVMVVRMRTVSRHWRWLLSALLFSTCTILWSDTMVQFFLLCSYPAHGSCPCLGHKHCFSLRSQSQGDPLRETSVRRRIPCQFLPYSVVCTVFLDPRTACNCLSNPSSFLLKNHLWVPHSGTPRQSLSSHLTTTYS